MKPLHIAILGAKGTGKTWLTQALADELRARGQAVQTCPALPCSCHGSDPPLLTPSTQARQASAFEQVRAAQSLATQFSGSWLLSDTTPLMTAVCCDAAFNDKGLYPMTMAHQALYDITLLAGLDLPVGTNLIAAEAHRQRGAVDSLIRQALETAGRAYRVVYGSGPQRINNALLALGLRPEDSAATQAREHGQFAINRGRTMWQCNECSDPGCEHKLFTRLMRQRNIA